MKTISKKLLYQQKIRRIVEEFKKIKPEKIILFGSTTKGVMKEDADIDICVIKKTKDRLKTRLELSDILWEKEIGFDPEIDLHIYPPEIYYDWLKRHDPFIEEIEKGKVLYEKRPA